MGGVAPGPWDRSVDVGWASGRDGASEAADRGLTPPADPALELPVGCGPASAADRPLAPPGPGVLALPPDRALASPPDRALAPTAACDRRSPADRPFAVSAPCVLASPVDGDRASPVDRPLAAPGGGGTAAPVDRGPGSSEVRAREPDADRPLPSVDRGFVSAAGRDGAPPEGRASAVDRARPSPAGGVAPFVGGRSAGPAGAGRRMSPMRVRRERRARAKGDGRSSAGGGRGSTGAAVGASSSARRAASRDAASERDRARRSDGWSLIGTTIERPFPRRRATRGVEPSCVRVRSALVQPVALDDLDHRRRREDGQWSAIGHPSA